MTENPPATGRDHLSADTLADLHEGLLEAAAARRAEQHLSSCPRCASDRQGLLEVSELLAAAPDVGPAPDDVTARIDAALAAERHGRAGAVTVTPLTSARRPTFGMRALQAAAVLVLLLAGAGLAVTAVQDGGSGGDAGSAAGGAAADKEAPEASGAFPVTASGRNWSQEALTEAIPRLVAGTVGPAVPAASAAQDGTDSSGGSGESQPETRRNLAAGPATRLAGGPALAECVTALNDGPVTPVAVDLASWQGQPAAVVILPTPGEPATVDTWVVAPDCSQADAKVLYFARVARP